MITVTRSESTTTPRRGLPLTTITWAWGAERHAMQFHPGKGDLAEQNASDAIAREEARLARRLGGIKVILAGTEYTRDADGRREE